MENGDGTPPTYEEAFPPLANPTFPPTPTPTPMFAAATGNVSNGSAQSAWSIKSIRSTNITQVFHIPIEERRYNFADPSFGVGSSRQSDIVLEIKERSGCEHIEISQSKDHSLSIMVSGKPSAVINARNEVLSKLQTQAHVELNIPKEHHKFVIGGKGQKLKSIEVATGTKVKVPNADDSSDLVKIVGTREGVDKARHQIQVISDEQAKLAFERLDIEHEYHPFIMGPNNSLLKQLIESTGARINMPPLSMKKSEISVAGDKDCVANAVAKLKKMRSELRRSCSTVSVEVKKTQHKYVVGPRAHVLHEILQTSGVWVEVPPSESDSNTITLRGPQEKLGQALTLVYERANSVVVEEVHARSWLHRFIIGRKGQNVQKITQDLPKVHVEFNSDLDKIILEGPPDQVQQAKEAFETFTDDLEATMDFAEIHVDQKYHRHIIGKGGASVNRIKTETGTSIIIPPDSEKNDTIRIEGDPMGVKAAKSMLLEMGAKMENERSKDLIIEHRFHKQIIGTKGEKIKEIRDRFNGVQVAFSDPGDKKDVVTLRGPREDVDKCATYLKKLYVDLVASNYREEVRIFKKFHGSVIGKGGATLRKIREDTDTKVDLPGESSESDIIVITGRKENVQKARARILDIEKEMASIVDMTVTIPHRLHNSIIGPKGKLVRSVMDECGGVRIVFPSSESGSDKVKLHGPKEDVEKANIMLLELADEQAEENHTIEITCKPSYHRFLIGRGGANIRKVRDKFGARVMFPQKSSEEDCDVVTIIGRKEKAEAAKEHLLQLIQDLDNVVEAEIDVDPKHHRHFVQRRGQLIREISEENGNVVISFPRSGSNSNKVVLKGAGQCVEAVKARIQEIVEDLEAQVTIECVIDHKHHRSILGARGANVQAITSEHNVSIKFPDRVKPDSSAVDPVADVADGEEDTSSKDVIMVTGREENTEAAIQALKELIPITEEMCIPFEFHRFIVGQRGRWIRGLMEDHDVNIAVPSAEKNSEVVLITGPAKNCIEARASLEKKVQQLEVEKEDRELRSFSITLNIDQKYHPNIIGRKGATINKIRDDHGVRIQLPDKESSNSDEIVVTGYEHQVNSAQEDIRKIVRELEEQISQELSIDHRVHSRLIGAKGKAIAKVMERFSVDIRFPRDKGSDIITITGLEENVEDAKEHLLILKEDYMQDVFERDEEQALMRQYTKPTENSRGQTRQGSESGFVVSGGPWSTSAEDFPTLGGGPSDNFVGGAKWGPSIRGPNLPRGWK